MLRFIFESGPGPYIAFFVGLIFTTAVRSLYDNDFKFIGYAERFIHRRKLVSKFFANLFGIIKERVDNSRQFFAGVAFTSLLFIGFSFAFQVGFLTDVTNSASNIVINKTMAINSPTRTVIDTTKPWVYNFSAQPDGVINTKIFNVENGSTKANYNNELETFTDRTDNVRIENGVLVIEAHPESRDNKAYTSGRIDTNGSFSFLYGTLEVEAKLPRGVGTWPAAWLMPSNPRYQASDFSTATDQIRLYSLNGELDFLESVGYLPGQNVPASHSYNSLARTAIYTPGFIANPYDVYHRYGIVKTAKSVQYTIDGKAYAQREMTNDSPLEWPFDQPYYLILNLSLGGPWAGKNGVDDASAPWKYTIKSITYTPASTSQ